MCDLAQVTFNSAQRALLSQLAEHWIQGARAAQHEAAACVRKEDKHLFIRKAAHFLACADELKSAIVTGDLPGQLGFQVRAVKRSPA